METGTHTSSRKEQIAVFLRFLWPSLIIAMALSALVQYFCFGALHFSELLGSWLLITLNAIIGIIITTCAIASAGGRFLIWSLGAHFFRIFFLILILVGVYQHFRENFLPFLTAVLTGYFVLLFGKIWALHRAS